MDYLACVCVWTGGGGGGGGGGGIEFPTQSASNGEIVSI